MTKQTCYEKAANSATDFAMALTAQVPELDGVSVVLSWAVPHKDYPTKITCGQHGPLQSSAELIHMAQQLLRSLQMQTAELGNFLRAADQQAAEIAERMRQSCEKAEPPPPIDEKEPHAAASPPTI